MSDEEYKGTEGFEELLKDDRWKRHPYFNETGYSHAATGWVGTAFCTFVAMACLPVFNHQMKRPYFAGGIHLLPLGIIGFAIGRFTYNRQINKTKERDAIMRWYMSEYPDRFRLDMKKIKDKFEEWDPLRVTK